MRERDIAQLGARARAQAQSLGVEIVTAAAAQAWLGEDGRTAYCLDVRSPEELPLPRYRASPVTGGR